MAGISLNTINQNQVQPVTQNSQKVQGTGFSEVLKDSISSVSQEQQEAKKLADGLLSGQHSNIHETMIAMEKSSISFKLLTKVQNKVVEAYQEIMRLQL